MAAGGSAGGSAQGLVGIMGGQGGGSAGGSAGFGPIQIRDDYAQPLYAEALIRNRAAVIDVANREALWSLPARTDLKRQDQFFRWDPWVRSYLLTQQALSGLKFKVRFEDDDARAAGQVSVELLLVTDSKRRNSSIVKIVRPAESVFAGQLKKVLNWSELRSERSSEILAQVDNQYPFWNALVPVQSGRLPKTKDLLEAAVQFSVFIEMRFKHELACWRPQDYSDQVQPMITTPGHGSLPSGHCTQAHVIAEVFKALMNTMRQGDAYQSFNVQLGRLSDRIATNRVIAGLHFPVDNAAGRLLGSVLGEYFVHLCNGRPEGVPKWHRGVFDGRLFDADDDYDPFNQSLTGNNGKSKVPKFYKFEDVGKVSDAPPSILSLLWSEAEAELTRFCLPFN